MYDYKSMKGTSNCLNEHFDANAIKANTLSNVPCEVSQPYCKVGSQFGHFASYRVLCIEDIINMRMEL